MILDILYALLLPYLIIRTYLEVRKMKREGATISPAVWVSVLIIFFMTGLFLRGALPLIIMILGFLVYEYLRKNIWEKQIGKSATGAFKELSQGQRILCIIIYFVIFVLALIF